jgi:hypothetical protein
MGICGCPCQHIDDDASAMASLNINPRVVGESASPRELMMMAIYRVHHQLCVCWLGSAAAQLGFIWEKQPPL